MRAAALMRIARVETASDRDRARRTFECALDEARRLSEPERGHLLRHARLVAAAVAPDLVDSIPSGGRLPHHFESGQIIGTMLDHGHRDAAFERLINCQDASQFPYSQIPQLMRLLPDDDRRLKLLRRAIEVWLSSSQDSTQGIGDFQFLSVFQSQWTMLPAEEARDVARDIVRAAVRGPDQAITAAYISVEINIQPREYRYSKCCMSYAIWMASWRIR